MSLKLVAKTRFHDTKYSTSVCQEDVALPQEEASKVLRETPEGWERQALLQELSRGLCCLLIVQHPLGETRRKLTESLAAAAAAAAALQSGGGGDETGMAEA